MSSLSCEIEIMQNSADTIAVVYIFYFPRFIFDNIKEKMAAANIPLECEVYEC
jgi:hypothetical protein